MSDQNDEAHVKENSLSNVTNGDDQTELNNQVNSNGTDEQEDEEMDTDDLPPVLTEQKQPKEDVLDLTQKDNGAKKTPSPDIIVLSDEEEAMASRSSPLLNGKVNGYCDASILNKHLSNKKKKLNCDEVKERKKLIRRLHEELRNEEMKLILLKKLRQSQQTQSVSAPAANAATPPIKDNIVQGTNKVNDRSVIRSGNGENGTPPPILMRSSIGGHAQLHKSIIQHSSHRAQSHSGQGGNAAALMMSARSGGSVSIQQHQQQRTSSRSSPSISVTPFNSSSNHSQNSHHDRNAENQQTPAQRQAAAKLALRKQLEKTLLQIPPPKPPPPEMHFIPNASNQEFVCLVGLESIVNLLIDDPSLKRPPPTAFVCVQCGTDFTPVWKWDNSAVKSKSGHSGGGVICENCLTSNQKKAAKAEHTNRLKTAFVKALQQEQEIEQRMSHTSSPTLSSSTSSSSKVKESSNNERSERHRSSVAAQHAAAAVAAQQSFLQAHQQQLSKLAAGSGQGAPPAAHMLPFNHLLNQAQLYSAAAAYQQQSHGGSNSKAADLQRQYLLDMIPTTSPRSIPPSISAANLNWKM